ncbi:MAG: hypothetical protein QM679_02500 [Patulibacter sp.]
MEYTQTLGNVIAFDVDAVPSREAVNHGRRASDRADAFAEIYDLASYATSGSRSAARVSVQSVSVSPTEAMGGADRAAADQLYLHLTSGGTWLRVSEEAGGRVVMRLHDAAGAPVRELSITELADDGPEVA